MVRPPELATLLMAWESARFTVVASPAMIDEYLRVLAYPDVAKLIYPELLRSFHSHLLHDIELIEPPEVPRLCRDPDDNKVIAAAVYGLVDYLLTVDHDLLTKDIVAKFNEVGISLLAGDELVLLLDDL
ncbi:MAG: putative toxin-antitoxin system toxin component, PIN family [Caldilinea sp. CFX5]|nr:putative toxin-antitoxin system toxin component, PIN family [Caldilinea sp. CFX5]